MYFTKVAFVGLTAMASFVAAQSRAVFFTDVPPNVEVGETYTIGYQADNLNEPVTILLREGDSDDLQTVDTLTTSATGGTFEWTVADYPESGNYALEIQQGDEVNFSGQFPITGGTGAAATSSTASGSSSTTETGTASSSSATITSTSNTTTTKTTASGAASTTMSRNTTMISHSLTTKTKSATATAESSGGAESTVSGGAVSSTTHPAASSIPTGNVAAGLASPFGLLIGVVGALAYLN